MLLVFSHALTEKQEEDVKAKRQVEEFISLSQSLRSRWAAVDPMAPYDRRLVQDVMDADLVVGVVVPQLDLSQDLVCE